MNLHHITMMNNHNHSQIADSSKSANSTAAVTIIKPPPFCPRPDHIKKCLCQFTLRSFLSILIGCSNISTNQKASNEHLVNYAKMFLASSLDSFCFGLYLGQYPYHLDLRHAKKFKNSIKRKYEKHRYVGRCECRYVCCRQVGMQVGMDACRQVVFKMRQVHCILSPAQ